ncbi:50S ribosomal protein L1 [Candidatus Babeliales bacterium]|nr:50S ribosomal protein L1 [Candidatus Babeliales bacterium]MCF7899342.1 50S ribosomal protein L1 [Candidatus Babeliales bacterium]
MSKIGKKHIEVENLLKEANITDAKSALDFIIKNSHANFNESVDASIVLGIDASKGEQTVRGSVLLPNGTGKEVKILVFAKGEHEDAAKKAGADFVGAEDLIEKIEGGWTGFDVAVATPDLMGLVGRVAKILGPKGLLPNKKVGTVTLDVAQIVSDLKKGRVSFRNDKGGIVHASFGKISFGVDKLIENLIALLRAVKSSKPSTSKGKFIKKLIISSTMGVGITLNPDEII